MKALFSSVLVSLILPPALFVQAVPTPRDSGDSAISHTPASHIYAERASAGDVLVANFAHVLEQLENTFYQQALAKFQAPLQITQRDAATHALVLENFLESVGATPLTCKFNFDPALYDVGTMLATARIAEMTGTSAYSGSANLITDPSLLAKVATIMTDEARHSTVQNIISGSGTAVPSAFDIALNASEVLAIVDPFVVGPCNTSIPPNPTLTITNRGDITTETLVTFNSTAFESSSEGNLFCQLLTGDSTEATPLPLNQCKIPYGVSGPTYIWVTYNSDPLPSDVVARSKSQEVTAGPALIFIDLDPQALGMAAVEEFATSSYASYPAAASPTSYGEPYGCWFHGRPCQAWSSH